MLEHRGLVRVEATSVESLALGASLVGGGKGECGGLGVTTAAAGACFQEERERAVSALSASALATLNVAIGLGSVSTPLGAHAVVNRAPIITTAVTSIEVVHTMLSVLSLERTYVVHAGRLLGVIRREQMAEAREVARAGSGS